MKADSKIVQLDLFGMALDSFPSSPIFKGSKLGAFCPYIGHSVLLPCIQPSKKKKNNLFSTRVKELVEPIVLRRNGEEVLLFLEAFS